MVSRKLFLAFELNDLVFDEFVDDFELFFDFFVLRSFVFIVEWISSFSSSCGVCKSFKFC